VDVQHGRRASYLHVVLKSPWLREGEARAEPVFLQFAARRLKLAISGRSRRR
jgi:hypothetical protein